MQILFKATQDQSQWLTSGLFAERKKLFVTACWSVNVACKTYLGTRDSLIFCVGSTEGKLSSIKSSYILRAVRVEAAHGGVAGWGEAGQDLMPTAWFGKETTVFRAPEHRTHIFWTLFRKHERMKPYVNRWGSTTRGWQPLYNRFTCRTTSALRSWLLNSDSTPKRFCKRFSCKACLTTNTYIF